MDGSNIGSAELAPLLPVDPDGSAADLRAGLRNRLGVDVAVVITDTMAGPGATGRPTWPSGRQGCRCCNGYAGSTDTHGNGWW